MLGVERGKNIAEVIVRRRAVAKRPEPAQKPNLLVAEAGNIDDGFRPGQNRQQAQQQHFVERIRYLATLPRVRQVSKMGQKDYGLAKRPTVCRRAIHRRPPRIRGLPQIQHICRLSRTSFTRLPWGMMAKGFAAQVTSPIMPSFKGQLTEDQVHQLVAYIKSMASATTDPYGLPGVGPATQPERAVPGPGPFLQSQTPTVQP